MDHLVLARRSDLVLMNKRRIYQKMYYVVPADHKIKVKGSNWNIPEKTTKENWGNQDEKKN